MTSLQHQSSFDWFDLDFKQREKRFNRESSSLGTLSLKIELRRTETDKQVILEWTSFVFRISSDGTLSYFSVPTPEIPDVSLQESINIVSAGRIQLKPVSIPIGVSAGSKAKTLLIHTVDKVYHIYSEDEEKIKLLTLKLHTIISGLATARIPQKKASFMSPSTTRHSRRTSQYTRLNSTLDFNSDRDYYTQLGLTPTNSSKCLKVLKNDSFTSSHAKSSDADSQFDDDNSVDLEQDVSPYDEKLLFTNKSTPASQNSSTSHRSLTDSKLHQLRPHSIIPARFENLQSLEMHDSDDDVDSGRTFGEHNLGIFRVPTRDFDGLRQHHDVPVFDSSLSSSSSRVNSESFDSTKREKPKPPDFYKSLSPKNSQIDILVDEIHPANNLDARSSTDNSLFRSFAHVENTIIPESTIRATTESRIDHLPSIDENKSSSGEETVEPPKPKFGAYIPPHKRTPSSSHAYIPPHIRMGGAESQILCPVFPDFSDDEEYTEVGDAAYFGRCSKQGLRPTMEDYDMSQIDCKPDESVYKCSPPTWKPRFSLDFHAIFDGHCGSRAAEFCHANILRSATKKRKLFEKWPSGPEAVMTEIFESVDKDFLKMAAEKNPKVADGTCALVALVATENISKKKHVGVANLGDSRAILVQDVDGPTFLPISFDHSPNDPIERARIERIGGWVTIEEELPVGRLRHMDFTNPHVRERASRNFNFMEISRVNSELAVSRAIGDMDYKAPFHNQYDWMLPTGVSKVEFSDENLVSCVPDWRFHEVNERTDKFLILGCDGLYETLHEQELAEMVLKLWKKKISLEAMANKLVQAALENGSSDNVTCIVVKL